MFMKPEITEKQEWVEIEGDGTYYIPYEDFPSFINLKDEYGYIGKEETIPSNTEDLFFEGNILKAGRYTTEVVKGYGVRYSAPGYLDCTDWTVFPTYKEAYNFFIEEADNSEDGKELRAYMRQNFKSPLT